MRRYVVSLALGVACLVGLQIRASDFSDIVETIQLATGETLVAHQAGATDLPNIADYSWWYGCSPTSVGMAMGFYDRNGYNGMNYGRLIPGGQAEATGHGGISTAPLAEASIASSGHIADFWTGYGHSGDDPLASGRTIPADFNSLADFMGTSQDSQSNSDGSTTFYYYTNGAPTTAQNLFNGGVADKSGLYGIYEYLGYRGYTPDANNLYNQYIAELGLTYGFTWEQYKAEIDAGRPVLIHVEGHTMCGIGYNDATNQVRLLDTWSGGPHAMTWGGSYSYSELPHLGVSVFTLPDGDLDAVTGGSVHIERYDDGFGGVTTGLGDATPLDILWSLDESSWTDGGDGWLSLMLYYDDADLIAGGIDDESTLQAFWWDTNSSQWLAAASGIFYSGSPQGGLGDYGVNLADNYAWVNIDHASDWILASVTGIIPEPSTLVLALIGALAFLRRR
ncbi:MAG: C39 family peptidase [Candidatus Pacebacteria bacterium]|nr:C39 family peptidase [Candidatus Paceibacterota bacterium]